MSNGPERNETILERFPFMPGNDKWGGEVQLVRSVVIQDGQERVYINKRLMFTGTGRYINLPRNGVDELVKAILAASEPEQKLHEALMEEIKNRRGPRTNNSDQGAPRRDGGRRGRGREDRGDWR